MKRIECLWSVAIFIAFMGFSGITFAGDLEPSGSPAPTMKTLDEIPPTWSQKLPASERFELVLDGEAVLDKETGLVWEQSPDTTNDRVWYNAIFYCYGKEVSGRKGWRLPTIDELSSLVDSTQSNPALPSGHPFTVGPYTFWSETPLSGNNFNGARTVDFERGTIFYASTDSDSQYHLWCVRGGR